MLRLLWLLLVGKKGCEHQWEELEHGTLYEANTVNTIGVYWSKLRCTKCGWVRWREYRP